MNDVNQTKGEITPKKKKESTKYVKDEQTGRRFKLREENLLDKLGALVSIIYLLLFALFFIWQFFDILTKNYTVLKLLGYGVNGGSLTLSVKIMTFTFIGGALGGIVKEIRSYMYWHLENKGFGGRFVWKSIASPWLGAILALFVYAITQAGIVIVGGSIEEGNDGANLRKIFSMFALGLLAGFGSHRVFLWLDSHVAKLFKVPEKGTLVTEEIPELKGMSQEMAQKVIELYDFELGEVNEESTENVNLIGKVISQNPESGKPIEKHKIDITMAVKKESK